MAKSTIDPKEIERFEKLADQWWDENGKYSLLHEINPLRISYIKQHICRHFKLQNSNVRPLKSLKLLDVGCGGGLISVPMARLGAQVTAIDAGSSNIKAAAAHAHAHQIDIEYLNTSSEKLAQTHKKFDVILALEIIEHVSNTKHFVDSLIPMLNNNGLLFISTINRTIKAGITAKLIAEYVLRWVPVGTHEYDKFVTPDELDSLLCPHRLKNKDYTGIVFKPLQNAWVLDAHNLDVNYIGCFAK